MATLLATVAGGDKAQIKAVLEIIRPFTFALIFELAALVSFGFAFGHQRKPSVTAVSDTAQTSFPMPANDAFPVETVADNDGNGPPKGGNRRRVFTRDAASADIIQLVGRGRTIPSQETLSDRWGVGKGTVSKWLARFEAEGLIQRETIGRCKAVRVA